MAAEKIISKIDLKLIETGIISPDFKADYKKVHTRLNSHVRKTGKILTEETFEKGNEELRKWLMELYKKGASQEKLTSYMRCGLAHLCCDFIESTYESISLDDLIARTLQSFKKRKFNKSFFKVASSQVAEPAKAVKKKTAAKKTTKKTAAKTVKKAAKKTTKKAAAKPKTVTKKSSAKKTSAKKSTAKKVAPKNTAARKTTSKTVSKKTETKKTSSKKEKSRGGLIGRLLKKIKDK